jgi:hypothetical protein
MSPRRRLIQELRGFISQKTTCWFRIHVPPTLLTYFGTTMLYPKMIMGPYTKLECSFMFWINSTIILVSTLTKVNIVKKFCCICGVDYWIYFLYQIFLGQAKIVFNTKIINFHYSSLQACVNLFREALQWHWKQNLV